METLIFTVQAICFWFALGLALVIVGNQVLDLIQRYYITPKTQYNENKI